MLRRRAGDFSGNAAQSLLDQLSETPAGAVSGQHGEIVQMEIGVPMGGGNLLVVDLAEPVIGSDRAGIGEDESADGVGNGGIFLHAPVRDLQIAVEELLVVEHRRADFAQFLAVFAVEDVGFGDRRVSRPLQHGFHAVLYLLHVDSVVFHLGSGVRRHLQGQYMDDVGVVGHMRRVKRFCDGRGDPG